jgi:predicted P-loop ATPase
MTVTVDPLDYYARHHCALFPIPAGSKNPTGIVESFKRDHSADPTQWSAWRQAHPQCNFGIVAFASRIIIVDVDTKIGRDEAWAAWCALCAEWGIPVANPHVQSARGGWHIYFVIPAHVDPNTLRQPDALKGIINTRCIGYCVAAGSSWTDETGASLPYTLLSPAAPYPAPVALIEHCTRRPAPARATATPPGSLDPGQTAQLIQWLTERGEFSAYEDWVSCGMSLRMEFHDAGFPLWELTFDETVSPSTAASKWESFATEPDAHSVTILSLLSKAHRLGWKGSIGRSTQAMFGDVVANLAQSTGATLASAPGAIPMLAGQDELARLAEPLLTAFLADTTDAPATPAASDLPALPPQMSGHALYALMSDCLVRVFALADVKPLKSQRLNDPLAVLHQLHPDVFESVCRRLRNSGITLQDRKIKNASAALQESVERITVTHDKWEYDAKGEIQSDNPDNVVVLLGVLGLELRWNMWLEQMELQGGAADIYFPHWQYVDDAVVAKLLTRSRRTKTRFRPGKDFLWETLLTIAHSNSVDPILDHLTTLAAEWDRTPRLITWLSRHCGTPCDIYHQAVGKLIIGGMVKRARHPGCKFDFMPIFYGKQGTAKSTMAAILADMGQTPVAAIELGHGQNFTDNVLLGDAAKELILALAGQLVAEIGEMGMRSNTNTSHVKAMISRQIDAGRTAYARAISKRPRRNIFIGTTNDAQPLSDPTGNRRFLPIAIRREIDLASLAAEVRQLIGEAAHLETNGADFKLPREVWEAAAAYQESARQASDLEVLFSDWFGSDTAAFITTADLVRLCDASGRKNTGQAVHSIMERLGFKETGLSSFQGKAKVKAWYRSPDHAKGMLPTHVKSLPQYQVDATNGGRVVLRMANVTPGSGPGMPSVPSR